MLLFIILLAFVVVAACLAWYFISQDKGEREPVGALWIALGLGFAGGIVAAIIESVFIPAKYLTPGAGLVTILVASLAIGAIEESCKFIPLSLFIYPKRYFNEHTDGVIYFALAGLGFGLPENILYTMSYGSSVGIRRMLLTPFFHAAITGMVGFFLIKAKLSGQPPTKVIIMLVLAMILHALYDFGLASGVTVYAIMSITITLGMTVVLFLLYTQATEMDQRLGLSVVGHNNFCRSCGQPNPDHHLYCTHCGKRA